ncbi:MAG: hypothetical protein ACK2UC_07595 [Anaerolineae bacterium]|jgi:hypothetical protein
MCYPDLRTSQALMEIYLAQACASSRHLPNGAKPISARRLRLLRRVGRALTSLGRRLTETGLELQMPDLPQPSH